jgi:hypothetical protein
MIVYSVDGFYNDNKETFNEFLITNTNDSVDELSIDLSDDDIFYYGLDVPNVKDCGEFTITDWEIYATYTEEEKC